MEERLSQKAQDRIGTTVGGRYVISGVLGHGGMGTVYLATQQPLGREVAVKVLHGEMARDEVAMQRFTTEAQTVSRLNHPNIVTLFDFGPTEDGSLFLAMEKLEGITVVDEVQRRGAFSGEETFKIVRDVARALAAAHKAGIVHRDLKPENVMLTTPAGGEQMVKVLDFGLAKIVESDHRSDDPQKPLTAADVIMGTPGYMSPEQIHGFPVDARADLYALGVIWWELLTGRQLFTGKSPIEVLMRHLEEKPPPPQQIRPGLHLPPAALSLLGRFLEKERDHRPPDGEAAAALLTQLEGEQWAVQPPSQAAAGAPPEESGDWEAAFGALGGAAPKAPTPGSGSSAQAPAPGASGVRPPMPTAFPSPPGTGSGSAAPADAGSRPYPAAPTPTHPSASDSGAYEPGPEQSSPVALSLDGKLERTGPSSPSPLREERMWTVRRGDHSEQVPESTVRRLARDGKIRATDMLSAPGERARPAHSFPSLGLKPPAPAPERTPSQPRPAPQGARAKSKKGLLGAAAALLLAGSGAGLWATKPALVEAWWTDAGGLLARGKDAIAGLSGELQAAAEADQPIAPLRQAWEKELGPPEEDADEDEAVRALLAEARAHIDEETRAGRLAADEKLRKALLYQGENLVLLGQLLENRARLDDAAVQLAAIDGRRLLSAGLAIDAQAAPLRRARAAIALVEGRAHAAEADLERLIQDKAGNAGPELSLLLAESRLDRDLAGARAAVDAATERAPSSTRVARLEGAVSRREGAFAAADERLAERLAHEPSDGFAARERAWIEGAAGRVDAAVKVLSAHLDQDPGADESRRLGAHLLAHAGERARAREIATPSEARRRSRKTRAALLAYRLALDDKPDPKAAAALAEEHPQSAQAAYIQGLAALRSGAPDEAVRALKAAIDEDSEGDLSFAHRSVLAEADYDAGRFEQALAHFRWVRTLRPSWLPAATGEALALLRLGRPDEARAALAALERLDLLAWYELHPPLGLPPDPALERVDARLKGLRGAPADLVNLARAVVAFGQGDDKGVEGLAGLVLRQDKNHPFALTLLGAMELRRDRPRTALARVGPLEVNGTLTPAARLVQARAAVATGATKKARRVLRALEGEAKLVAPVQRVLGEAALRDGNVPQAGRLLRQAYRLRPDDEVAAALLRDLERGR